MRSERVSTQRKQSGLDQVEPSVVMVETRVSPYVRVIPVDTTCNGDGSQVVG
jgi:hypothetical protein